MRQPEQFEAFMKSYQDMVYSTAMRLLANGAEAEDIAQEVFLKAYERFDQLHQDPRAGGWLRTVATNLSLKHLTRYRSRWSFFSELFRSPETGETVEPDFADESTFEDDTERFDRHEMVELALQRLPAAQRVPLVLFHIEGLAYEEIATKLGVSLGKVKTDIFRGREALRRTLKREELNQ